MVNPRLHATIPTATPSRNNHTSTVLLLFSPTVQYLPVGYRDARLYAKLVARAAEYRSIRTVGVLRSVVVEVGAQIIDLGFPMRHNCLG